MRSTPVRREVADAPPPTSADGQLVQLPTDRIDVNPHQPRRDFDAGAISELAASLRANGLIQPVVVRPAAGGRYELIAGERRLRAAREAGLASVAAVVRDVDAYRQAQMALVENVQREDLNPIDRATAYRTILDQLGLTQGELADRVGEDRSTVANFLRLLDLAAPIQEHVRAGRLTLGHAKVLAGIASSERQRSVADRAAAEGLSVRNLERLAAFLDESAAVPPPAAPPPPPAPHLDQLQRRMRQHLGSRVDLPRSKNGKGRIVLHYGSIAEFEKLAIKLGVDPDLDGAEQ